jgi:hypothetical protein
MRPALAPARLPDVTNTNRRVIVDAALDRSVICGTLTTAGGELRDDIATG